MDIADVFSNVIAIAALLLSCLVWWGEKKSEKRSREFELFKDTYQEHLAKNFPDARAGISITSAGYISGTQNLIDELNSIRKDSLYFQYAESSFFEELVNTLRDLEDYLVLLPDQLLGDTRETFEFEMQAKSTKIYKCILNRF